MKNDELQCLASGGIPADRIAPSVNDTAARVWDEVQALHDEHRAILAKFDMMIATLANIQEQMQAVLTRVYSR